MPKFKFKVITGTAKEVEDELNKIAGKGPIINGMSATNEQTTVLVSIYE